MFNPNDQKPNTQNGQNPQLQGANPQTNTNPQNTGATPIISATQPQKTPVASNEVAKSQQSSIPAPSAPSPAKVAVTQAFSSTQNTNPTPVTPSQPQNPSPVAPAPVVSSEIEKSQPKNTTPTETETPSSDASFDLDSALANLEEPTPTPEPTIKLNPRNMEAVVENHHEDIANGVVHPETPVVKQIVQVASPTTPTKNTQTPNPVTPPQPQTPTNPAPAPITPHTVEQPQNPSPVAPAPVVSNEKPVISSEAEKSQNVIPAKAGISTPSNTSNNPQQPSTPPQIPTIPSTPSQNPSQTSNSSNTSFDLDSALTNLKDPTPVTPTAPQTPPTPTPSTPATPTAPTVPVPPTTPTTPTKANVVKTQKKGMRIGFTGFAIGCVVFLMLIAMGGGFVLRSMFQNYQQSRTIIDRKSAEILLKLFAGIVFISLTLFGTFFTFVNIFRIASKKNTSKARYIGGIIVGVILLLFGLGGGIRAMTKLSSIINAGDRSGKLVSPYIVLGNGEGMKMFGGQENPRLIAPAKVVYKLDTIEYKALKGRMGLQQDLKNMMLSCGNGQSLPLQQSKKDKSFFFGPCFYTKKGAFPVEVSFSYTDRATGQQVEKSLPIRDGGIPVTSAVELYKLDGTKKTPLQTNDTKTELIAGKAPAKIAFNAQKIISELGLKTNDITWDIDGDGKFERTKDVVFSHNFIKSQLHTIFYRIGSEKHTYQIPLRVEQSNVPICTVNTQETQSMSYDFNVSFVEPNATINQYMFEIIDRTTNRQVDRVQSAMDSTTYDFTKEGKYAVKVYFITTDGGKGTCQSADFRVGAIPYTVDHTITVQGPGEDQATPFEKSTIISGENNTRTLTKIPTKINFAITDIRPRSETVRPVITIDDKQSVSADNKTFSTIITTTGEHTIKIGVHDDTTGKTTIVKTYNITVELPLTTGTLKVEPKNVGYEPFVVTLDASTMTLNDPDDEVIYFSRDFGDGEIKKNQNQGKIQHTYLFDKATQKGIYQPSVTITTRKGQKTTLKTTEPITVKRALRKASIVFDSHPAQIARANETIKMSLTVDNIPTKIVRDFGDSKTFQCNNRSCNTMEHTYDKPGTYQVSATISYEDYADITAKTKLIIDQ